MTCNAGTTVTYQYIIVSLPVCGWNVGIHHMISFPDCAYLEYQQYQHQPSFPPETSTDDDDCGCFDVGAADAQMDTLGTPTFYLINLLTDVITSSICFSNQLISIITQRVYQQYKYSMVH